MKRKNTNFPVTTLIFGFVFYFIFFLGIIEFIKMILKPHEHIIELVIGIIGVCAYYHLVKHDE